jgi:SHS2 domain-containing protein
VKPFQFLEHTADKGAIAYGTTLEELFANGALSMVSLMCRPDAAPVTEERRIELSAPDLETLFVRWLSELVYLLDTEGLLGTRFQVESVRDDAMAAIVGFARVDRESFAQEGALVKAITYHGLEIVQKSGVWSVTYYVDV